MRIKNLGDPILFEYWCFGMRVAARLALALLLITLPLFFTSDLFSMAHKYLALYSSPVAAKCILIVAGIIIGPYLFAVIGSLSYRLQDDVPDERLSYSEDENVTEQVASSDSAPLS